MAYQFPFFDLTRQYQTLKPQILETVARIFEKQTFVMGDEVLNFEKEMAQFIGVRHAVTCGSGTEALILALKALDVGPGDDVLTTPFSFFASTSSILLAGANPVFADIEPETYNLDTSKLERALTKKTKAILPVHLFGQTAEMEPLMAFAKKHGLMVLEDAAQSLGAKYAGQNCMSIGTMGATSFYPTKNLGGAGEGGLVTTNDDRLAERARLLRVHGMKVRYTHDLLGWNTRMDALQAAVLRIKLPHLEKWTARRQTLARQYFELLREPQQNGKIVLPKTLPGRFHVWNQFTVMVPNRDDVRKKLDERGIPTDIFYPKTIPVQPALQKLGVRENDFPVAVDCAKRALALPIFPELTDTEQKAVTTALVEVLGRS